MRIEWIFFILFIGCALGCTSTKRSETPTIQTHLSLKQDFKSIEDIISSSDRLWTGTIDTTMINDDHEALFVLLHDWCSGLSCPELFVFYRTDKHPPIWRFGVSHKLDAESIKFENLKLDCTRSSLRLLGGTKLLQEYKIDSLQNLFYKG